MQVLQDASVVFFTGGDQLRITSHLGDSPVYTLSQDLYFAGGTIAGTSAGASVMSETMLVNGPGDASFKIGSLNMAPGLGLIAGVVIDQHFAERGRIGRLLGAVAHNPFNIGVRIDQDTAIVLDNPGCLRVLGEGAVYILDGTARIQLVATVLTMKFCHAMTSGCMCSGRMTSLTSILGALSTPACN